jgi:hypothetical protein
MGQELGDALDRIRHCLDQLTEAQVWWRPADDMNSIGNLLLHLTGNIRQWVVSALGAVPDRRDRPAEFAERRALPTAEVWSALEAAVSEARRVFAAQSAEDWMRVRRVQGYEISGLGAAVHSVAHFRGHTQEIIHLTRTQLGAAYQYAWVPATREQGA